VDERVWNKLFGDGVNVEERRKLRFEGVDNYVNDSSWNRSLLLTGWRLLRGR
jgi:hypothetical protein